MVVAALDMREVEVTASDGLGGPTPAFISAPAIGGWLVLESDPQTNSDKDDTYRR